MSAKIQCRPNGPYLVTGPVELTGARAEGGAHEAAFALCRCGGSKNKPFCDGTHRTNGFSDARLSDPARDKVRSYPGPSITIHDNRSICAHAAHCTDGAPTVFKYGEKPWIDPAGAPVAAIVETIRRCPSGALSYAVGAEAGPVTSGPARITVRKDGPYAVTGDCELVEAPWAQGAPKDRYTLCRCGHSKNKPFCDGSHHDAGFRDG